MKAQQDDAEKVKTVLKVALAAALYVFYKDDLDADEALNASDTFFKAADEQYPGWTIEP